MSSFIPQTSLFIGIIPALILLYIGLKGYEGHFKDKLIFLMFIVGIIIGFISAVIELLTQNIGLIIYIILFQILEQSTVYHWDWGLARCLPLQPSSSATSKR
jgi:hypothetical protein